MSPRRKLLQKVQRAAEKRLLFLPHAVKQMSRPERMITVSEVRSVVSKGQIIEDYPEDPRGHSCLMLGKGMGKRTVHVVCSPKADYLAIIAAYLPTIDEWDEGFSKRRTS